MPQPQDNAADGVLQLTRAMRQLEEQIERTNDAAEKDALTGALQKRQAEYARLVDAARALNEAQRQEQTPGVPAGPSAPPADLKPEHMGMFPKDALQDVLKTLIPDMGQASPTEARAAHARARAVADHVAAHSQHPENVFKRTLEENADHPDALPIAQAARKQAEAMWPLRQPAAKPPAPLEPLPLSEPGQPMPSRETVRRQQREAAKAPPSEKPLPLSKPKPETFRLQEDSGDDRRPESTPSPLSNPGQGAPLGFAPEQPSADLPLKLEPLIASAEELAEAQHKAAEAANLLADAEGIDKRSKGLFTGEASKKAYEALDAAGPKYRKQIGQPSLVAASVAKVGGAGAQAAGMALTPATAALAAAFQALTNSASVLQSAMAPFTGLVEKIDPGLIVLFNQALEDLQASMGQMFVPLVEMATKVADTLNAAFTQLYPLIEPVVKQLADAFEQVAGVVINAAMPIFEALVPVVQTVIDAVLPLVGSLTPLLQTLADTYVVYLGGVIEIAQQVLPVLANAIQQAIPIWQQMAEMFGSVITEIVAALRPLLDTVLPIFADAITAVAAIMQELLPAFGTLLRASLEPFKVIISTLANAFGILHGWVNNLAGGALPTFSSVLNWLVDAFRTATATFGALISTLGYIVNHAWDLISGNIGWSDISRHFSDALERLRNGTPRQQQTARQPIDRNRRTQSARPAQIVGIEQIGQDARAAAFGARSVQERQLEALQEQIRLLREVARNGNFMQRAMAEISLREMGAAARAEAEEED